VSYPVFNLNKKINIGYCAGLAFAVPIYNEFFYWYISITLLLPLLFCLIQVGFVVRKPNAALIPFGLLFIFYVLVSLIKPSEYAGHITKELMLALYLFLIYLVSSEESLSGFFDAIIPLGVITALIGLIKAGLLDRGYLIGYIIDSCNSYPAGSGLCLNYNNLGLIWLIACLGCINRGLWYWIPLIIAAGALVGSRRFLVLMFFVPVIWFYFRRYFTIAKAFILVFLSFLIINLTSSPESFERFRFGAEEYKIILSYGKPEMDASININRSTPSAILGTMSDGTLGTSSRLDLWAYAWDLVSFKPQGLSYHIKFSCEFSGCADYVYPHSSILSAWLAGGFIFAVVAVFFYLWPLYSVFASGSIISISLLLISMPYSLISGDTVFSIPIFISAMIVALSSLKPIKFK
jgi:hypothetical protein